MSKVLETGNCCNKISFHLFILHETTAAAVSHSHLSAHVLQICVHIFSVSNFKSTLDRKLSSLGLRYILWNDYAIISNEKNRF